jgi:hypothetical protein
LAAMLLNNELKINIMKLKFLNYLIAFFFVSNYTCNSQINIMVAKNDFTELFGKWKGKLIYLDYKTSQPYEMPADIEIVDIKNTNKLKFSHSYPNESSANSIDTLTISTDGKMIDKEVVKSKRRLNNGNLEIVTEVLGKDGNDDKPAILKHTYLIAAKTFSIRKDIQFVGEKEWIKRHEYSYVKD